SRRAPPAPHPKRAAPYCFWPPGRGIRVCRDHEVSRWRRGGWVRTAKSFPDKRIATVGSAPGGTGGAYVDGWGLAQGAGGDRRAEEGGDHAGDDGVVGA